MDYSIKEKTLADKVPIIKDLDLGLTASDFRDNIHLSAHGPRNMASHIKSYLKL